MFAVIMKSDTPVGVRTTLVAPVNGATKTFSKVGEGRGAGSRWVEGEVQFTSNEQVVGLPKPVRITPSEASMLAVPITPSMFLWKATKELEQGARTNTLKAVDVYKGIVQEAISNPSSLDVYAASIQVMSAVQEMLQSPIVVTQQPVVEPLATPVQATPLAQANHTEEVSMQLVTAETRAPLTVPEFKRYEERTFDGLTETELYDWARTNQVNVLLTGDAGTGKTSSARNYAYKRSLPLVVIECTQQIDQTITQGQYVATGVGNSVRWVDSPLVTAIQQGSVILINELTRMLPGSASLFLRLFEEREMYVPTTGQTIKVHPDCIIVADQNTGGAYTGTRKQDGALIDRFGVKIEFKYDINIEKKFIDSPALLQFASSIRQASDMTDEFSVPLSTRLLQNFQAQARGLNLSFAIQALLNAFPKGDGERDSIKMRIDADIDTIARELGVNKGSYNL